MQDNKIIKNRIEKLTIKGTALLMSTFMVFFLCLFLERKERKNL